MPGPCATAEPPRGQQELARVVLATWAGSADGEVTSKARRPATVSSARMLSRGCLADPRGQATQERLVPVGVSHPEPDWGPDELTQVASWARALFG